MSIIDLDDSIVCQIVQVAAFFNRFVNNQLSTIWNHEVLLEDTEQFPLLVTIVWIEEEGQVAGNICLIKVNTVCDDIRIHWVQIKETKTVLSFCLVTWHINIIKSRCQGKVSKWHLVAAARANQPVLLSQPEVRNSCLFVVFQNLLEKTKVVVQSYTITIKTKCRNRVQEAGSQTTQASVTQRRLQLNFFYLDQVFTSICQLLLHIIVKSKVDQVVRQKFTNQELCWNIVEFFLTSINWLLSAG